MEVKIKKIEEMIFRNTTIKDVLETKGITPITPSDEELSAFSELLGYPFHARTFWKIVDGRKVPTVKEDALLRWWFGITSELCTITRAALQSDTAQDDAIDEKLKNIV